MESNKINTYKIPSNIDVLGKNILQYSIGALLYTPAVNNKAVDFLVKRKYPELKSLVFCLEDSINDESVLSAEDNLEYIFEALNKAIVTNEINKTDLPLLFIRVRNPEQIERVFQKVGKFNLLTGFIFPKFDMSNASEYLNELYEVNSISEKPIYAMPILESKSILDLRLRNNSLYEIKMLLDEMEQFILNIRIGGNDFCNVYGIRRSMYNTIYDIGVIRDVISSIVNVFGHDYIISAPVWEYFGDDPNDIQWALGLQNELTLDKLNGLIGKTAIHPQQISIINASLKVDINDYNDAIKILDWQDVNLAVSKSSNGGRMNEKKVHENWAKKILVLASIYGINNI
jgi:citrate lyase beta subunit